MIDESLINAYRLAKYIVTYEDEEYRLQVGSTSEFVDRILHHQNIKTAYFITPENPFSCTLSAQENALRKKRFCKEIDKNQYFFLPGYGTDEAEKWPRESSYLIFTDDDLSMQNLAAHFGQNAMLKIPYKTPVQLLLLEQARYIQS
jgi:predicted GIY-YIG superfamily endonuclease